MKAPKAISLKLNKKQLKELKPLFDYCEETAKKGKRGILLGQPWGKEYGNVFRIGYVEKKYAEKICKLGNEGREKGEISPKWEETE